jgi:hypothetical protein
MDNSRPRLTLGKGINTRLAGSIAESLAIYSSTTRRTTPPASVHYRNVAIVEHFFHREQTCFARFTSMDWIIKGFLGLDDAGMSLAPRVAAAD